jgi:excisionase family DNA binding protein
MSTTDHQLRLALTLPEVAELTGTSVSTLRRAIAANDLLAVRIGSAVRLRPIDVDEWLRRLAGSEAAGVVPVAAEV